MGKLIKLVRECIEEAAYVAACHVVCKLAGAPSYASKPRWGDNVSAGGEDNEDRPRSSHDMTAAESVSAVSAHDLAKAAAEAIGIDPQQCEDCGARDDCGCESPRFIGHGHCSKCNALCDSLSCECEPSCHGHRKRCGCDECVAKCVAGECSCSSSDYASGGGDDNRAPVDLTRDAYCETIVAPPPTLDSSRGHSGPTLTGETIRDSVPKAWRPLLVRWVNPGLLSVVFDGVASSVEDEAMALSMIRDMVPFKVTVRGRRVY